MKLKNFLLGAGLGFFIGFVLKESLTKELISPEKALRIIKRKLARQGTLEGSWIHMIPESYERGLLEYTVYRGGVSCTFEGDFQQFDFIIDGHTGTILELSSQDQ